MIAVNNLQFSYGSDFEICVEQWHVNAGEKVAVIGNSGCGKTTFISLIAGIYPPQKGKVTINNQTISAVNEKARRNFRLQQIGFIFQNFELLEYLNLQQNILLPFTLQNQKISKDTISRLHYLLNQIGLYDKIQRKPQQLSQGEKQRVAIARALIHKPSIIIADEPTGNLDPSNSEKIMELLWNEIEDSMAFIMVTHDHSLLQKFDSVWQWTDKTLEKMS